MGKYIDTEKLTEHYRMKGISLETKEILITNFFNTEQSKDFTLPSNCEGFGRIHHFKRHTKNNFPLNSLPIDPAINFLKIPMCDMIKVQVFQNAVCSWRCWYCFVDYKLLSGNKSYSEFKTVDQLVDLYLNEKERSLIIDLSGGQPDLFPEWSLWFADTLFKRGLSEQIYLWSDDNLSNDFLWSCLTKEENNRLASYKNYGRVGCFKGFDNYSFSFNTGAAPHLFDTQFHVMKKLVISGFDIYGYITLTSDKDEGIEEKISDFLDRIQHEIHEIFPLRIIPLPIIRFTPTDGRITNSHERALAIQDIAVEIWKEELSKRFSVAQIQKKIFEHRLTL